MAALGAILLYESYLELLSPTAIINAELAMAVALSATAVSSVLLIYKDRAAKRYASLALKADAKNSIKDVLTFVTAFAGIASSRYFNIIHADAIAGIVISLFVFTMVYPVIKEASFVLMDACQCQEIVSDIENIVRSTKHVKQVHSLRLRKTGPYVIGDMHVVVDADLTVRDSAKIAHEIEEQVKKELDGVTELKIRIEPDEPITK
jgi:cation diffusion facilitator family transporter